MSSGVPNATDTMREPSLWKIMSSASPAGTPTNVSVLSTSRDVRPTQRPRVYQLSKSLLS
jgi:hypothetical protein